MAVILPVRPSRSATSQSPMVSKSKPKTKTQKKAPLDDKAEPVQEALPDAPVQLFSVGDAVHHHMFGDGKVESIQENKLTIAFDKNGTKVIREDFVTRKR
jgi:hypothetical protein